MFSIYIFDGKFEMILMFYTVFVETFDSVF